MADLYAIVSEQFPEFVRQDYSTFIQFVQEYYKWVDTQSVGKLAEVYDIDKTPEEFVQYYKSQLDIYSVLSDVTPYNKFYLEHIKEIYSAKGSEQALIKVLQMVHGSTEATVSYPNEQILRASDGRWKQESFITVTALFGTLPSTIKYFYVDYGNNIYRQVYVTHYQGLNGHTRLFYNHIELNLVDDQHIEVRNSSGNVVFIGEVVDGPSYISINSGGSGWQLGQVIVIPGTIKNTIARISRVNSVGSILNIELLEVGYIHTENQIVIAYPTSAQTTGTQCNITLKYDKITKLPGKWETDAGKISNQIIRLEDNFYYQQYSYVINNDINSKYYSSSVDAIHPAGMKAFYNYNIVENIASSVSAITDFPFITRLFKEEIDITEALSFEFTSNLADSTSLSDTIAFNLTKYFSGDTISVVSNDTNNKSVGMYAAADYFSEIYNVAEITLNIGV